MTIIIGYAYEADTHCVACAKNRFPPQGNEEVDQHGIPMYAEDSEGNVISPMFTTDEMLEDFWCGACGELIIEVDTFIATDNDS